MSRYISLNKLKIMATNSITWMIRIAIMMMMMILIGSSSNRKRGKNHPTNLKNRGMALTMIAINYSSINQMDFKSRIRE